MINEIKYYIGFATFLIARRFGYVTQDEAAIAFAEGWKMREEVEIACWQSVEEAFANSDIQATLPSGDSLHYKTGELELLRDGMSELVRLRELKESK